MSFTKQEIDRYISILNKYQTPKQEPKQECEHELEDLKPGFLICQKCFVLIKKTRFFRILQRFSTLSF